MIYCGFALVLASALKNNQELTQLKLGGGLSEDITADLLQTLSYATSLRVLDLTGQRILLEAAQHLGMW